MKKKITLVIEDIESSAAVNENKIGFNTVFLSQNSNIVKFPKGIHTGSSLVREQKNKQYVSIPK